VPGNTIPGTIAGKLPPGPSAETFMRASTLLFLVTALIALQPWLGQGKTAARPNIVFIMADDLGYQELACYGQKKIKTPHIDRIAHEGIRFLDCYAGSSVCAPSRSVLMTGLHSGHTPIRSNGGGKALWPEDITVAEVLKEAGYATGCFGKWGLGIEKTTGHPNRQGFDVFFGYLHQVHAHFYYPYFLWSNETRFPLPENEGRKRVRYSHDEIQAQAVKFIRKNKDRPFFCYLPYTIPHVELVVPEDSLKPYLGKWKETPLPDPRKGYIGSDTPYATFAGMVSRMDRDVGKILTLLEELKIADNTIVIFTSDNGAQGGPWARMTDFFHGTGHLRGYKGQFYEGGIRVPLVARWPGHIRAGSVTAHPCGFWDVLPTLAELAEAKTPKGLDGISLVPTLLGQGTQKSQEFLYWGMAGRGGLNEAVRMGNWKLLKFAGGRVELYDLAADPSEIRNVAKKHPEVVGKIQDYLKTARTKERTYPPEKRTGINDYVR
jgi:arylsulfatase A